ncbi:MAG: YhbY family RNA-binding protein [Promethearchaeota archaeon]
MKNKISQKKPDISIGKSGITEQLVKHVKELFKKSSALKVRILKSAVESRDDVKIMATNLAKKVNASVVDVRGNTFVMSKK